MFESFLIGRYMPGDRFLHRMDPRCKLVLAGMLVVPAVIADSAWTMAVHAAAAGMALYVSRIPLSTIGRNLKGIAAVAFAAALLQLFGHSEGEQVVSAGVIAIHTEGVRQALLLLGRIMMPIVSVSLLTSTTSSADLAYGLDAIFRPLRKLGLPAGRFAFLLVLSIRFLPVFLQEIDQLAKALQAREGRSRRAGFFALVPRMGTLLVLAFAHGYRRAEGLALGLEARGYRGEAGRVRRRTFRFGWRDAVGLLAGTAYLTAAIVVR